MKILKLAIILLAICLAGCSFSDAKQEETMTPDESMLSTGMLQTEMFNPAAESTEQTKPYATQPPTTEPPATEATQLQEIIQPEPKDEDFVIVREYIPDIVIELRYSTEDNFTGQEIYEFSELWLRYGTVKKLMLVQEELKQNELYLKIWDGFRPPSAQFKLWEVCPDPTYVSNPNNGFSSHSRGNTVDITLVDGEGTEVVMPTGFDDFSALADRDYSDCSQKAKANALLLEQIMISHGFRPYSGEWWHYTDEVSYPVEQSFEPIETARYYADCNEYISLRTAPDTAADVITTIRTQEEFQVVAQYGDFLLIRYDNLYGYVLRSYAQPVE